MIIGVDIDGVLANFNEAYRTRLTNITGRDLIPADVVTGTTPENTPPCWSFDRHYGYTVDEIGKTWDSIKNDGLFWQSLRPLPGAGAFIQWLFLNVDHGKNEVYYITSRPGLTAKEQTETWLRNMAFTDDNLTVMIARDSKGLFAKGLGLDVMIDDKGENCIDVKTASPGTKVYMPATEYNRYMLYDYPHVDITTVRSLNTIVEELSGAIN